MATTFPIKGGVLQGDLDADGWTILNLDKTGLDLNKSDVGLGNVDNTSDLNKPVSIATTAALALKEDLIVAGTAGQFWDGTKSWVTYGSLALENGVTTKPLISVIGAANNSNATLEARRNDYSGSNVRTKLYQTGSAVTGTIVGLPAANIGGIDFEGATYGIIRTTNSAPLLFGVNNVRRARLGLGLNVGGDGDPGAGCITCYDTLTAGHLVAGDLTLELGPGSGNLAVEGSVTVAGSLITTLGVTVTGNLGVVGHVAFTTDQINFTALPTSNPGVAGRLWRSTNTVMVSTG